MCQLSKQLKEFYETEYLNQSLKNQYVQFCKYLLKTNGFELSFVWTQIKRVTVALLNFW